ncbi:MAG: DNA-3-methyladenine glycosylase [Acidobacteriota bacterium]|jgi:DNA-3-methyladenine glycosylase II|nr:DNA-3-methyladenine glycosylase [Acidobacteriota bacterium]
MEVIIKPRAPFDFAATARFLRFTDVEAVDTFVGGIYRRAITLENQLHLLTVESRGTLARPQLAVTMERESSGTPAEMKMAEALARRIFSTEHDLKRFRAQVAGDALMSKLEAVHRGLHMACWPDLFEALVISILLQQISTAVAMTLKRRFVEKFGESLMIAGETFHAFPRAAALATMNVDDLRALGLSGAKAISIIELARRMSGGELDEDELERLNNESLMARLTQLRGIGRWTAEWALMLHFGRTDVFPAGDLALRGFVVKYYNDGRLMTEREIRALAQMRWGKWASYAAVYFLAGMRAGIINLRPESVLLSN